MVRYLGVLLLIPVVLLCGCLGETLNIGNGRPGAGDDGRWFIDGVQIHADNWNAGERATLVTYWHGGFSPFDLEIDLDTSKSQPAVNISGMTDRRYECSFILEEGSIFNWSVKVTSSVGSVRTESGSYGPVGPPLNNAPEITSAVYDEASRVLTVTVSDVEGNNAEVSVTDIAGLSVDRMSNTVSGGNGTAEFVWSANSWYEGGSGTTTVSVTDAYSEPEQVNSRDVEITVAPLEINLAEGQLGVFPLQRTAAVGDTVTVVVATGPFPAEAPFAFMNGVGVTVTDGGDYVSGTFNVGDIGGERKDADGIWAGMDPVPSTFFVPEDFMMAATDVTTDSSLDFMGFNITPVGGGEITTGGMLFNFGIAFASAGTYELGLLEFQDVKRTYYSDGDVVEYYWPDIENSLDVPVTVTVN